jgi:hypothetical protein
MQISIQLVLHEPSSKVAWSRSERTGEKDRKLGGAGCGKLSRCGERPFALKRAMQPLVLVSNLEKAPSCAVLHENGKERYLAMYLKSSESNPLP